jgi:hypothetical protein
MGSLNRAVRGYLKEEGSSGSIPIQLLSLIQLHTLLLNSMTVRPARSTNAAVTHLKSLVHSIA